MDSQTPKVRYDVAIEYHNGDLVAVHHIKIPDYYDKGWYVTIGSLNGFHNRCMKRIAKHHDKVRAKKAKGIFPPLHFSPHYAWDIESPIGPMELMYELWEECPNQIYHDSIFDFYANVGIDYKRDKWPTLEYREREIAKC